MANTSVAIDIPSSHSLGNKIARVVWNITWLVLFRPTPKVFYGWRRVLLRLFGATIGAHAYCHPAVRIWAPWNLTMGAHSSMGAYVDCYSVDRITIGEQVTISQYSFLCAASHDIQDPSMPLITAPIFIGAGAWVAADVFIGPGVVVGEGAVIGARSSVFSAVDSWTVVVGTPAKPIKRRVLRES